MIDIYAYVADKTGLSRLEVKARMMSLMYSTIINEPKSESEEDIKLWLDSIIEKFFK